MGRSGSPHLGETRGVRLPPQGHPARFLHSGVQIRFQARGVDPPACGGPDLCAAKTAVQDERDDFVDLDLEHLGHLRGREHADVTTGVFGHAPIIGVHGPGNARARRLWKTHTVPCGLRHDVGMNRPRRPAPRAFRTDLRFLIGIALILASIVGVWLVVQSARHSDPIFAAARTLVEGQEVTAADLRVVEVTLGAAHESYVAPGLLEPGAVLRRTVAEGELLPRDAVTDAGTPTTATVVVESFSDVPASVAAGSIVEVWVAPVSEGGSFDTPRILVPRATVVSVDREGGVLGQAGSSLEIVIDRADTAQTLAAVSDGSALSVVPAGAP